MALKKKSNVAAIQRMLDEKTPGPHGVTLEMRKIPRRTVVVLHEHRPHTTKRYDLFGGVANRATRRAYARAHRVDLPGATLEPYRRPRVGTSAYDAQLALYAGAVPI